MHDELQSKQIQNIVIVGGGSAGWMTAVALSHRLKGHFNITLVESDEIGTVGVGESTIPHIQRFNNELGISETEFIQQTNATIKLGIKFCDWARIGDSYMHPFSETGHVTHGIDFHHYWLKLYQAGKTQSLDNYSVAAMAANARRFAPPITKKESLLSTYTYSYHINATAYAAFLKKRAMTQGVERIEGKITEVRCAPQSGFIDSVILENGRNIAGDLFVDCSGFSALLIGKSLKSEFIDWSHWLPTDRAVVAQCEGNGQINPFTLATARSAGWQWQIPLQQRIGNGHVYSSAHMSDQAALDILVTNLPGKITTDPRVLRFKAGFRAKPWQKNCVAIGLSAGFLEPLESTSIFLVQMGIVKLLEHFPDRYFHQAGIDQYNMSMSYFYEQIRNFIILHYHATERTDSEFWNYVRTMEIPDELHRLMTLFVESGRVDRTQFGIWSAVCIGQRLIPQSYDSRVDRFELTQLEEFLANYRTQVQRAVDTLPPVEQFIRSVMAKSEARVL